MNFNIFQRFRRRRDAKGSAAILKDTTSTTTNIILSSKKNHKRRSRFQRRKRKQHLRRQNRPFDVNIDNNDDRTDRESFSSHSSNISNNNNSSNISSSTSSNNNNNNNNSSNSSRNNDNNRCRRNSNEYNVAEVGRPPKRLLRKKERMTFKIYGFAECAEKRGECRLTPTLQAHGYNWKLQVYPRGDNHSNETSEYVSCYLHYFASQKDRQAPVVKVEYRCGMHTTETQVCTFAVEKGKCSTSWGLQNFIKRDRIVRNCLDEDGALSIDVNLQIAVDRTVVWYPPSMRQEPTLLQLYHSVEETGDAAFRLTTASNKNDCSPSRSATSSPLCKYYYKAHKMILALRARILFELICEDSASLEDKQEYNVIAVVDLPGVDRDTFEAMLEHIYTVKQPIIRDEEAGKKLLVAADRFCLTDLKLYVESVLVNRFATVNNAASLLLFADSHSCALLKETTMDLYANDPSSVIQTPCWAMVEESETILSELSKHVHTGCRQNFHTDNRNDDTESSNNINEEGASSATTSSESGSNENTDKNHNKNNNNNNLDRLDVFSIRERLGEYGIEIDGSRETLLGRLRNLQEVLAE